MDIEEKLNKIDKKVDLILELLDTDLKKNCEKMGNHIDFVETVYDKVRNPLGFMCNRINEYCGKDEAVLQLEDIPKTAKEKENVIIQDLKEINNISNKNWYLLGGTFFIGCLIYKYYR